MLTSLVPLPYRLLAIAIMCAGLFGFGYVKGLHRGQDKLDAYVAKQTEQALQADLQALNTEHVLAAAVNTVGVKYAQAVKANSVAAARSADSLREFQATLGSPPSSDPATPTRDHGTGGPERELLGECAETAVQLAITADRLENKVVALQDYIKATKLAPAPAP